MLLRVSVTNMSAPDVTVDNWDLKLNDCRGDHWLDPGITFFNVDKFRFAPAGYPPGAMPKWTVDRNLATYTRDNQLIHGKREDGWLWFGVNVEHYRLFGARFVLSLTDSLGNMAACDKYPGVWIIPAEFEW
jgi:hypothetical protein